MTVEVPGAQRLHVVVPHAGLLRAAAAVERELPRRARYVRRLAANLAPYAREGCAIVANSTSCGLMLKREAREILEIEDDDLAGGERARCYDLCEFLLLLHERGELPHRLQAARADRALPRPCQQQGPRDRQARARPASR